MVTVNRARQYRGRAILRHALIALSMFTAPMMQAAPAAAQVSIGISIPGISIGIHQPFYPELVLVPGSPVYYAPQAQANYFFYDGLFWVYQDDRWYSSAWYDGPWDLVDPYYVPLFVLRVPVHYYVRPPVYFYGWVVTAPPRWDIHWGPRWAQHRHGWDQWDRRVVWHAAPPPLYQRHFSGDRYPRREYQHSLRDEHYRYQPRDAAVRQRYYHERSASQMPARVEPPRRYELHQERSDAQRAGPPQPRNPAVFEQGRASSRDAEQREHGDRGHRERVAPPIQSGHVVQNPLPVQRPRENLQRHAPAQAAPQMQQPQTSSQQPAVQQRQAMRNETDRRVQHEPRMRPYQEREPQGRGNDQQRGR